MLGRVRFSSGVWHLHVLTFRYRKAANAIGAVQSLSLRSGGFNEAWIPMINCIEHLKQLVMTTLRPHNAYSELAPDSNRGLWLTRRVFTKVSCHPSQ